MEFFGILFAENAKCIINIFQPQGRWGVKRSDSLAFNVFHKYVGNDWRVQEPVGVPNVCL